MLINILAQQPFGNYSPNAIEDCQWEWQPLPDCREEDEIEPTVRNRTIIKEANECGRDCPEFICGPGCPEFEELKDHFGVIGVCNGRFTLGN